LIVIALTALNPKAQIAKANDQKRKSNLKTISIALEDYANDNSCYPAVIYNSNGTCTPDNGFKAYLPNIPCDPLTKTPYVYERPDNCKEYIVYATLELETVNNYAHGNYILTSPNVKVE